MPLSWFTMESRGQVARKPLPGWAQKYFQKKKSPSSPVAVFVANVYALGISWQGAVHNSQRVSLLPTCAKHRPSPEPIPILFFRKPELSAFPPEKLPVADAVLSFIRRGGKGILGNRTDSDIVACQSGLLDFSFFIDNVSSSCANNASWQIEGSGCRNCFPKVDLV